MFDELAVDVGRKRFPDLVGVDGSTACFTWSTAGSALALTLEIALPPTTEWDLVEALKVTFHDLVGTFTPNPTVSRTDTLHPPV